MYEFFLYTGQVKDVEVTGAYIVEQLLETLPEKKNFKVFFDKWFSSISLCIALKKNGYMVIETRRNDWTKQFLDS